MFPCMLINRTLVLQQVNTAARVKFRPVWGEGFRKEAKREIKT